MVTREGVSITVTAATLTADKTRIEYRIFGVPGTAYPEREDVMGCASAEYLRLPDDSRVERVDDDFAPLPAGVDQATFVICVYLSATHCRAQPRKTGKFPCALSLLQRA